MIISYVHVMPTDLVKELANRWTCFNRRFIFIIKVDSKVPQSDFFSSLKIIAQPMEINSSGFFYKIVHGFPPPRSFKTYLHTLQRFIIQDLKDDNTSNCNTQREVSMPICCFNSNSKACKATTCFLTYENYRITIHEKLVTYYMEEQWLSFTE